MLHIQYTWSYVLIAGTHHTQKAADLSVWEGAEKENLLNKKITVI